MDLTPSERKQVLEMVADRIVADLKAEFGGSFKRFIVLPTIAVVQWLGMTSKTIALYLPVTKLGGKSHGVRMDALEAYIEAKTEQPTTKPAKAQKGAKAA